METIPFTRCVASLSNRRFDVLDFGDVLSEFGFEAGDERQDGGGARSAHAAEPHARNAIGDIENLDFRTIEHECCRDFRSQHTLDPFGQSFNPFALPQVICRLFH